MDYTDTLAIISSAITQYGLSVLAIITSILAIGLAYLVFTFGWYKLKVVLDGFGSGRKYVIVRRGGKFESFGTGYRGPGESKFSYHSY